MRKIKKENKIGSKLSLRGLRVYILTGLCGILAVLSIFMTIESASTGAEISSIQKKEAVLTREQQDLEASLVTNLSVHSLQEKSLELGFAKFSNLVYVSGGIPVAR